MPKKNYYRYCDIAEKVMLSFQHQGVQQAFLIVVEGVGTISGEDIENALKKVAFLFPVCRSRLAGHLKTLRWEQFDTFPLFYDLGQTKAAFCDYPLEEEKEIYCKNMDLKKEPPVAVYSLSDGRKRRIYFKINHIAMDGFGAHCIINDTFRLLRGKKPLGPSKEAEKYETLSKLFDASPSVDFLGKKTSESTRSTNEQPRFSNKMGNAFFSTDVSFGKQMLRPFRRDRHYEWCNFFISSKKMSLSRLNGKFLAGIAEVLKKMNPGLGSKTFQAIMPINLRYLLPGLRNATNLFAMVMIELNKYLNMPYRESVVQIDNEILQKAKNHFIVIKQTPMASWLPIWLMSAIASIHRKISFYRKKFPHYFIFTGTLKWETGNLSTETFKGQRVFCIPIMQYRGPLCIVMMPNEKGVEVVCSTDTDREGLLEFAELLQKEMGIIEAEKEPNNAP